MTSLSTLPKLWSTRSPKVSWVRFDAGMELTPAGGKAVAAPGSVAEGGKVVQAAVQAFGTVHVLINNAGILRTLSIPVRDKTDIRRQVSQEHVGPGL